MKKIFFSTAAFMLVNTAAMAQTSFAIFPMRSRNVPDEVVEQAISSLYSNLIESKRYRIVDRQRIKDVLKEQEFQMSGATNQKNTVKIGRLLGIDKIIDGTIFKKGRDYYAISINVIDVETGAIEYSKERSKKGYSAKDVARFCAAGIINDYPLMGKVLGASGGNIAVDLGADHGLKTGSRLFVARRELMKGDDGSVLFQEMKRIGTLRITRTTSNRSIAGVLSTVSSDLSISRDDIVSPEPIPKKEVMISRKPLFTDVEKGKLVLKDNMSSNQYLSVTNNRGASYESGTLNLDATHKKSGHAYCYYSAPADNLSDFIMEGEFEFQPTKGKYNKLTIVFRSNAQYGQEISYSLFFNDNGQVAIDMFRQGTVFHIVPLQSSPLLKRGAGKDNEFRIVARGSLFDIYINDKFAFGFEHEYLERGTIGFFASYGSHVRVDDIRIWEIEK